MTFEEQVIDYYMINLVNFAKITDEKDPTLYNALFQLNKVLTKFGTVPRECRHYFTDCAAIILADEFGDYSADGGELTFFNYLLEDFIPREDDDDGSNGAYNFHTLSCNTLRSILKLMI